MTEQAHALRVSFLKPNKNTDGEWAASILTYQDIDGQNSRKPPHFDEALQYRKTETNKYKHYGEFILDVAGGVPSGFTN
jgi:hypothetical protein